MMFQTSEATNIPIMAAKLPLGNIITIHINAAKIL
ncbi:hypothetical protein NT04LS_1151, partial [Listeria seeligeri FSL S4-171]